MFFMTVNLVFRYQIRQDLSAYPTDETDVTMNQYLKLTLFIPASETTDFYRGGVISPPQQIRFSQSPECTKVDANSYT